MATGTAFIVHAGPPATADIAALKLLAARGYNPDASSGAGVTITAVDYQPFMGQTNYSMAVTC